MALWLAHKLLSVTVMFIAGTTVVPTVIVTDDDIAVSGVAQLALLVISKVITSLFTKDELL